MKKLILNFKSKELKKIKYPEIVLGGKGANLAEMGKLGLPVPPGFTISTKACEIFFSNGKKINQKLHKEIKKELIAILREKGFKNISEAVGSNLN